MSALTWKIRDLILSLDRPLVMGIVNVTPDSFSDGGNFVDADKAIDHALTLASQGADILDVGGESTRPESQPVPLTEELRRVVPVISAIAKKSNIPISVDTSKAEVARQSIAAGASIINDVTALTGEPKMELVARDTKAGVILMHMKGTPATMNIAPHYDDVVSEVAAYLRVRLLDLESAGIDRDCLAIDPGISFGKKTEHNLKLLAHLDRIAALGRPLCLGVSRKGFIGKITGKSIGERAIGSVAIACHAIARGNAHIVRVHDVDATVDALKMLDAIRRA